MRYTGRRNPEDWLLLFYFLAFAGWLWELALTRVATGCLVNRGFLHGPWLPIYGIGGLLLLRTLREGHGTTLILQGAVVGGAVEYAGSLLLETFYHQRWWDYAGRPGNLGGRVCLESAAAIGIAGWLLARAAGPVLLRRLASLDGRRKSAVCKCLSVLFALDLSLSVIFPHQGAGVVFPL